MEADAFLHPVLDGSREEVKNYLIVIKVKNIILTKINKSYFTRARHLVFQKHFTFYDDLNVMEIKLKLPKI